MIKGNSQQTDLEKLSRELHITRIFCMLSSFLTILVLIGGVFFFMALRQVRAEAEPIIQQISALDVESFNETLAQVDSVDWAGVSQTIEQLDVDALNRALGGLDTEELSKAMENLNRAVETLERVGEAFSRFTSFFQ